LVFSDDFSDEKRSRENWSFSSAGGRWEISDGELRMQDGTPQVALLRQPVSGDVRLEFDCHLESDYLNDVSCGLLGVFHDDGTADQGYELKYGGWDNSANALVHLGERLWNEPAQPLRRGERYHVRAERVGARVTYAVNDRVVFSVEDPHPVSGWDHAAISLFGWKSDTRWSNVRVFRLGEPAAADLLALAERELERGNPVTATDLFTEVLASTNEAAR